VGRVTVIEVQGDLDIVTTPRLREMLGQMRAGHTNGVVIDLRECQFIDSHGLETLLHAGTSQIPPEVALVSADGAVAKLLELTAIDQTIRVFKDVEAATAAFGQSL
jgi:anti-anti-sigma factor